MDRARQALQRLQEGNRRFVSGTSDRDALVGPERRGDVAAGQQPTAVVLGCSDSRVPPEIIFDQGLGDLFVVRVAGNIAGPSQVGSIEFAVEQFGAPLVVVLGHSGCGAVTVTLDDLVQPTANLSADLRAIIDRIRPAVEDLPDADVPSAVRANVRAAVHRLRHGSRIIAHRIRRGGLLVVGAEYVLDTGVVDFFDGLDSGRDPSR